MRRLTMGLALILTVALTGCSTGSQPKAQIQAADWQKLQVPEAGIAFEYPADGTMKTEKTDRLISISVDGPQTHLLVLLTNDNELPVPISSINISEFTQVIRAKLASERTKVLSVTNTRVDNITYFVDATTEVTGKEKKAQVLFRFIVRERTLWTMAAMIPEGQVLDLKPTAERVLSSIEFTK